MKKVSTIPTIVGQRYDSFGNKQASRGPSLEPDDLEDFPTSDESRSSTKYVWLVLLAIIAITLVAGYLLWAKVTPTWPTSP